jgi:hypothetical protein
LSISGLDNGGSYTLLFQLILNIFWI